MKVTCTTVYPGHPEWDVGQAIWAFLSHADKVSCVRDGNAIAVAVHWDEREIPIAEVGLSAWRNPEVLAEVLLMYSVQPRAYKECRRQFLGKPMVWLGEAFDPSTATQMTVDDLVWNGRRISRYLQIADAVVGKWLINELTFFTKDYWNSIEKVEFEVALYNAEQIEIAKRFSPDKLYEDPEYEGESVLWWANWYDNSLQVGNDDRLQAAIDCCLALSAKFEGPSDTQALAPTSAAALETKPRQLVLEVA